MRCGGPVIEWLFRCIHAVDYSPEKRTVRSVVRAVASSQALGDA